MINFISGVLNSVALVGILNFFFGSSTGSKSAGDTLGRIAGASKDPIGNVESIDSLKDLKSKLDIATSSGDTKTVADVSEQIQKIINTMTKNTPSQ